MTHGHQSGPGTSPSCRPRRARAGTRLLLSIAVGLVVATPMAIATSGPAHADDSEVTVPAPGGGSVTVEKTEGLVNEVIVVSWDGFRPSQNPISDVFSIYHTRYPVRVYQCRTADPVGPADCYGSDIYDYPGREDPDIPNWDLGRPDGPSNWLQTATAADGTGSVDVEVMTKVESVTLGCNATTQCSIVVVPNYGDPTRQDLEFPEFPACAMIFATYDSVCTSAPHHGNVIDAPWAWDNRVVIPLSFADTGEACEFADAEASVLGSPKSERAFTSWQRSTCTADTPVTFDYTSQGEGLSRSAFLNGLTDVALTSRPIDPASLTEATRPFTYAPVASSAVTVAFRVDDLVTHLPIAEMKLNPRLIAKLITESYGYFGVAPEGADYGNPATRGNPVTLFADPEFIELNPGPVWPSGYYSNCAAPIIMADLSDLTYELTRYLESDPEARAFLDGEEDEWGMQVNTNFVGIEYPAEAFELRDPDEWMGRVFQPIQGLNQVARKMVTNSFAGTSYVLGPPPEQKPEKCGPGLNGVEPPGTRAFVAIIDTANAAAYRFPTASLLNGAGEYVAPTLESMDAAVAEMVVNEDGITRSPDFTSTEPAAYPLTTIDYAIVPTSGLDDATAESVGRILDQAAGPGQELGQLIGGLPPGYLPLGDDLIAQTVAAAAAVRAQAGAFPTPSPSPTPTPSASPTVPVPPLAPGGGTSASGGTSGSAGAGAVPAAAGGIAPAPSAAAPATEDATAFGPMNPVAGSTPAWFDLVLPAVLIGGLGAALLGSSVLGLAGRVSPAALAQRIRPHRSGKRARP